jgi:acetyl esterase/lipase
MLAMAAALVLGSSQSEPTVVKLWPNGAPGSEKHRNEPEQAKDWWVKNVHDPSVTVFRPAKPNGCAVLVCPGGGHNQLVFNEEGTKPAKYLASLGVTTFALKYRLFREPGSTYPEKVSQTDAWRAMRYIRAHAADYGIDPKRVGVLGFSAGGETVNWIAYPKGDGDPNATDPIDRLDGRPNFQMLVYPGPLGVPDTAPADSPPAFLVVASDDGLARVSLDIATKLRAAKVPVELHLLTKGGHGFNMGDRSNLVGVKTWPNRMADWLADNGWLTPKG